MNELTAEHLRSALAFAEENNRKLRRVVQGMLNISPLWLPTVVDAEHEEEAKTLHMARSEMLSALDGTADTVTGLVEWEMENQIALERKKREEHFQMVIDQALRETCCKLRFEASASGEVCGPCSECRLEPYYGWIPEDDGAITDSKTYANSGHSLTLPKSPPETRGAFLSYR